MRGELKTYARALVQIKYDISAAGDIDLLPAEQQQVIQAKVKPLLVKGAWAHYTSPVLVCIILFFLYTYFNAIIGHSKKTL